MLTVCIGYDPHEIIAYHVLAHSIMARASKPVRIMPIMLSQLKGIHDRPRNPEQSTDFTYTRFLTPWLSDYEGTSIFLDADMLCLTDIYELHELASKDLYKDVLVVKHDYTPNPANKFLNQKQTTYPMKNWSSVMVFNGHRMGNRNLTPEYVNTASAMELHQFKWTSEDNIGELPAEWNHLVGEYAPNPAAKIVHYTRGGPYFKGHENCEYSEHWFKEFEEMCHCETYSMFRNAGAPIKL